MNRHEFRNNESINDNFERSEYKSDNSSKRYFNKCMENIKYPCSYEQG